MAVKTFTTYNQSKADELFANSLSKSVDQTSGKESLVLKNHESTPSALSTIAIGRADNFSLTLSAPDGTDPSKLTLTLTDAADASINAVTINNLVATDYSQTLKNKTIDCATSGTGAGGNIISNLELSSLKSGVLQTSVRAAGTAVDTSIASEAAVRTELNKKLDAVTVGGVAQTSTLSDGVRTVDVPLATSSATGVVKPDGTTITVDSNGTIAAVEHITYKMQKADEAESGYLATYKLMKTVGSETAAQVGASINIPKDFLVKSAKVVTATNYEVGTTYNKCDVVRITSGETVTGYIVKASFTAEATPDMTKLQAMDSTPAAGTKVIVFVINSKDATATDEFLSIQVSELLTVYTAGNGLSLDANHRFSVNLTSNGGLKFDGNVDNEKTLAVSVDGSTIEVGSTGTVQVKNSGIDSAQLKDAAVTTAKVADGAVTTDKIADANVTTAKLAAKSVTTAKIDDKAVTSAQLSVKDTTAGTEAAVATSNIQDAAVTTDKIADAAVTTDKLSSRSVTTGKIADSAVETAKIKDANVTTAKIADDAVTKDKVANSLLCKLYEVSESDGVLTFTQLEETQA